MTARERDRTLEDGTDLEDLAAMLDEQSVLLQRLVEMAENRPADASGKDGTESGDGPTLATLDASVLEVLKNLKAQSKTLNRLSRTAGADAGGKDDAKSGEKPTLATIDAGLLLALDALDAQSKMLDDLMQSPAAGGGAAPGGPGPAGRRQRPAGRRPRPCARPRRTSPAPPRPSVPGAASSCGPSWRSRRRAPWRWGCWPRPPWGSCRQGRHRHGGRPPHRARRSTAARLLVGGPCSNHNRKRRTNRVVSQAQGRWRVRVRADPPSMGCRTDGLMDCIVGAPDCPLARRRPSPPATGQR